MADRPVFIPRGDGRPLVQEISVEFAWHPGMAASQKRKNVAALHEKAAIMGLFPLLEVSTKSESDIGQQLSAFNLVTRVNGRETTVECAFQGSKVFERGGPFHDLYWVGSRKAKRDPRLKESGHLVGFSLPDEDFPTIPGSAFYDWLYLNALYRQREILKSLQLYLGFTDIEFNPARSLNCQARSCATVVALDRRLLLDDAVDSFGTFSELLQATSG